MGSQGPIPGGSVGADPLQRTSEISLVKFRSEVLGCKREDSRATGAAHLELAYPPLPLTRQARGVLQYRFLSGRPRTESLKATEKSVPKLKTHKGAAKRFKKTASGKIVRRRATARHILTSKSRKRKRKLRHSTEVSAGDYQRIARMLL